MGDSMTFNTILQMLTRLFVFIPILFIFIICLYYLIRNTAIDSILLTIGSFLRLCCGIFGSFIMPYLMKSMRGSNIQLYYTINSFFGFIATIIFGIGLLICFNKLLRYINNNRS